MLRAFLRPFAAMLPRQAANSEKQICVVEPPDEREAQELVEKYRREMAIEMVAPEEAVRRLEDIGSRLKQIEFASPREEYVGLALQALVSGARLTIHLLNDEHFSVPVPFEKVSRIPSLPTAAADAAKCAELIDSLSYGAKGLLASFADWAPFLEYDEQCCCGRDGSSFGTMRTLRNTLMLRNIVERHEDRLRLRQYIGVHSATDMAHLYEHYSRPKCYGYADEDQTRIAAEIREVIGKRQMVVLYGAESIVDWSDDTPHVSMTRYFHQHLLSFDRFLALAKEAAAEII